MLKKLNRLLSILLIVTVVGVGLLYVYQHRVLNTSQRTQRVPMRVAPPQAQHAEKGSKVDLENFLTDEELAMPETQKLLQALETPESQAFLETQPGSIDEVFDFLEAQGIETHRDEYYEIFNKLFEQQFPGTSAEALEPEMRQKMAEIFLESGIDLETAAQGKGIEDVITEFLEEKQNLAWLMEYFQGDYIAFGMWAIDAFENPTAPTFIPSQSSDPAVPVDANDPDASAEDVALEPAPQHSRTPNDPIETESDVGTAMMRDAELLIKDTGNTEETLTPDALKLPADEERLRTTLGERFSAERYNAAIETLNRYGPQEGIRRLKTSDPQIATHIQRLFGEQKGEN